MRVMLTEQSEVDGFRLLWGKDKCKALLGENLNLHVVQDFRPMQSEKDSKIGLIKNKDVGVIKLRDKILQESPEDALPLIEELSTGISLDDFIKNSIRNPRRGNEIYEREESIKDEVPNIPPASSLKDTQRKPGAILWETDLFVNGGVDDTNLNPVYESPKLPPLTKHHEVEEFPTSPASKSSDNLIEELMVGDYEVLDEEDINITPTEIYPVGENENKNKDRVSSLFMLDPEELEDNKIDIKEEIDMITEEEEGHVEDIEGITYPKYEVEVSEELYIPPSEEVKGEIKTEISLDGGNEDLVRFNDKDIIDESISKYLISPEIPNNNNLEMMDRLNRLEEVILNNFKEIKMNESKLSTKLPNDFSARERGLIDGYTPAPELINYLRGDSAFTKSKPSEVYEGLEVIYGVGDILKQGSEGFFEFISKNFPFVFVEYKKILEKLTEGEDVNE